MNSRIGILTSGGDCSGLNSVIVSAYKRAKVLGYELIGIKRGLRGLTKEKPDYIVLDEKACNDNLITEAGSILYCDTKWIKETASLGKTIDEIKKIIANGYKNLGIDGLIYIGGDGSMSLLNEVIAENKEMNIIAIPKTIDNDVGITDFSVGFKTAVNTVCESIENIRQTAISHERVIVVEIMGRDSGFLAMYSGVASGADVILVPEFKYDFEKVREKVEECFKNKERKHCIIAVAEAVEALDFKHEQEVVDGVVSYTKLKYAGIGNHIAEQLKTLGFDARSVTLGHTQRGGKTCVEDRIMAFAFGARAVDLINKKDCGKLLCYINGKIEEVSIKEISKNTNKKLDKTDICVNIAKDLGVYIGEV